MVNVLQGNRIFLRALEQKDLDFLYELENDSNIWEISGTLTPYSRGVLKTYLQNAHRDIYEVRQLRLAICSLEGEVLGLIDMYDFDPKNRKVGIGIIVKEEKNRNMGIGAEAISVLCDYGFSTLGLHQVYANILESNERSIHLFKKLGFSMVGIKKDWVFSNNTFKNELLFQKINQNVS
ncbi:MAG: N-acetyltransferase [Allomuricauda sp.]|nr:MAG: N-acetyltransferase [Allomuricauda sp.]